MDFINRFSGGPQFDLRAALKFHDIDPRVQRHLAKVYSTLAATTLVCAVGCYVDMLYHVGGLLTFLASLVSLFWLASTSADSVGPEGAWKRSAALGTYAFCMGTSVGPLVGAAIDVSPGIVVSAVLGTGISFACFTAASLLTKRRSYMFIGGWLSNALLAFMWMRLAGWLFGGSVALWNLELYGGLLVFAGYVVYDTQLIVERAHAGDFDVVKHTLDLFVDAFAIFVRLLVILLKNQEKREADERRRNKQR